MKIRTVGALAALGMLVTSLGVRSLSARPERSVGSERTAPRRPDRPLVPTSTRGPVFEGGDLLRIEGRLGHARLPAGSEQEEFAFIAVRADRSAIGRESHRHLSILIDRSGSMEGKKLDDAIDAAKRATHKLRDGDLVSVIDYQTTARVLVSPTTVDASSRERVERALSGITSGGDTCISCALEESADLLRERAGFVSRVLLLSDGQATRGETSVNGMRRFTERVRAAGATISTIGLGVDYNEQMMAAIAANTNGNHHFVEGPAGLAGVFERELGGLERSVARDVSLSLELAPGVELLDVADRSFRREGSRVVVDLGIMSAGEERTLLARLRVDGGAPGDREVLNAHLDYTDLRDGHDATCDGRLFVAFTSDGSRSRIDPLVEERVARSTTTVALTDANELFRKGDSEGARRRVAQKAAEVQQSRAAAVAAAPKGEVAALGRRFDRQLEALDAAREGFAEPPASIAADERAERDKASLKRNQVGASKLAF